MQKTILFLVAAILFGHPIMAQTTTSNQSKTMRSLQEEKQSCVCVSIRFYEQGNMKSFKELVNDDVINHATPQVLLQALRV